MGRLIPLVRDNPYPLAVIVVEFRSGEPDKFYLDMYSSETTYSGAVMHKSKDGRYSESAYTVAVDVEP